MTNPRFIDKPLDDRLTPIQQANLTVCMEEACEVAQACSKILRFGLVGRGEPHDLGLDNLVKLKQEWNDLFDAITRTMRSIENPPPSGYRL